MEYQLFPQVRILRTLRSVLLGAIVLAAPSVALALSFDVNCNGSKVGAVTVNSDGTGISGGFTSVVGGPPPTLSAAAKACNEDHFNWYQVRIGGDPPPKDAHGNIPTIPFVDPPPGGWDYGWADNLPWYWDETAPANGKNPDGTPYDPAYQLKNQTTADTLKYEDFPAGGNKIFDTWLVSLNADGSFDSWHGGFTWTYSKDNNNVTGIASLNGDPTNAQYKDIIGGFATSIPEPSSAMLLVPGLLGLFWRFRKRA